jgi:acid stress-induced BolA-like protein IbaG/YrbA
MNSEQLTQILKEAFPEAEVAVSGQAGKFDLRIVDDQFEGKRTLTRQQAVYAPLILISRVVKFTQLLFVQ